MSGTMDTNNPECTPYGEPAYWNNHYTEQKRRHGINHSFEFYCPVEEVWDIIQTYCGENLNFKVLVIGCGSSKLSETLYNRGFKNITSIDTSAPVIGHLVTRYQDYEGMEFLVMDARYMARFDENSFDIVFDKGCLDSVFCTVNSYLDVLKINQEICRILKPGRNFISISGCSEKARMAHFNHGSLYWEVDHSKMFSRPEIHVYMMTVGERPEEERTVGTFASGAASYFLGDDDSSKRSNGRTKTSGTPSSAIGGGGCVQQLQCRDAAVLLDAFRRGKIHILDDSNVESVAL